MGPLCGLRFINFLGKRDNLKPTWSPTRIFLVSAFGGNTACTWGTTQDETVPPSGPMPWTSCRSLVMTAKYCGKSSVKIRVIRLVCRSSISPNSEEKEILVN